MCKPHSWSTVVFGVSVNISPKSISLCILTLVQFALMKSESSSLKCMLNAPIVCTIAVVCHFFISHILHVIRSKSSRKQGKCTATMITGILTLFEDIEMIRRSFITIAPLNLIPVSNMTITEPPSQFFFVFTPSFSC